MKQSLHLSSTLPTRLLSFQTDVFRFPASLRNYNLKGRPLTTFQNWPEFKQWNTARCRVFFFFRPIKITLYLCYTLLEEYENFPLRKCFLPSWTRFVSNYSAKLCWRIRSELESDETWYSKSNFWKKYNEDCKMSLVVQIL